jgi:hypothetical protein
MQVHWDYWIHIKNPRHIKILDDGYSDTFFMPIVTYWYCTPMYFT